MSFWRRHYGKILVALAMVFLLVLVLRPTPLLVDSERVSRGRMAQVIEEEGRTRVAAAYLISAPLAAEVRRLELEPGDEVRAGQVVARLMAPPAPPLDARQLAEARARVEGAVAAVAAAEREREALAAAAELSAAELARSRQLAASRLISDSELDTMIAEARRQQALERAAGFRLAIARHQLESARSALVYTGARDEDDGLIELTAPVDGVVLRRHFISGRTLQPGDPILEIGDVASLEVEVDVLSADAVRLAPGMKVDFTRWGREEPLAGRVRRIEPGGFTKVSALGVEEQRVLVIVDFTATRQQWQRLGDGYRVNARFVLWEEEEVLRLPVAAAFRQGEEAWAVFVVDNGRARLRPVELGRAGGRYHQLLDGLQEGDRVIVHPPRDLEDGARISLR
ncbi:efflux RND transporter periplasmic adaptor subunit [Desulfurivibrio dismutans]|uniref:efflux RND transporter periplasmic adaptor subunit n=1 Tax=Desulfurivibrio dismutans TaxID=1398908 RepID=UPI0023DC2D58|nr:efflux RND transporter periplasmic adaptor subunit [Desulfurivibrio alkaliphilus]MDF1615137.1 efflux RND transporter periplasmic adaptor subunit [Desulfurivibrio alkaliphilus]